MTISNTVKTSIEVVAASGYVDITSATLDGYLTPLLTATAYNFPQNTGKNSKVGIISLGGGWLESDLQKSMNDLGVPVPTITTVLVNGATNNFSTTDRNFSFENTVDLYMISALVPDANIVIYITPDSSFTATNWNAAIDRAVGEECDTIVMCFSTDEIQSPGDFLGSSLANAAAKSITVITTTGDSGSAGSANIANISAPYPATNPLTTAVGGTNLTVTSTGIRSTETTYNNPAIYYSSGGGISTQFAVPTWQQGLTFTTNNNGTVGTPTALTGRGVPDISGPMNAYAMYYNGTIIGAVGTSLAAPLMAALAARFVSIRGGKRLGQINPLLYQYSSTFYDITTGNDLIPLTSGYNATVGWDPVTGLGAPNGLQLYQALYQFTDPRTLTGSNPNSSIKYGLGLTYLNNNSTNWQPLKGMWINQRNNWSPVKTGWLMTQDGTWERIYPTPRGVFGTNIASINPTPYQHYADQTRSVLVTNVGDFDLVINSIVAFDSVGNFTTVANNFPASPLLLTPNSSTTVSTQIFGNVVGSFTGNLLFTTYTGYLGYGNISYPVYVNVLPDYAAISSNVSSVANLFYYQGDPATGGKITNAAQTVSIVNSGNGANLVITNATSQNGYFAPYNLTANTLGFNFNTFTGNTANITVAPVGSLSAGTYNDALIVTSNATNFGSYKIPVTVNVGLVSGHAVYETPGVYTLTVPPHVYSIRVLVVGSGGGGGLSISNYQVGQGGSGGGGGSGGYSLQTLLVTPGETLTVSIGVPGGTGSLNINIFYVATNSAWSSFMNSYAVWFTPNSPNPVSRYVGSRRELIIPTTGNYTVTGQAASNMIVSIDGNPVLTANSYLTSNTAVVSLSQGLHRIDMQSINNGGVGGFALTVQDSGSNLVWSTRSLLDPTAGTTGGSTTLTGSFGTVSVAGGAGGNGGYDDTPPPATSITWDSTGGFDTGPATDGNGTGGDGC